MGRININIQKEDINKAQAKAMFLVVKQKAEEHGATANAKFIEEITEE